MIDSNKSYLYFWSRKKNLQYGARKYIEPLINFLNENKNKTIELNERFLTNSNNSLIQIAQSFMMILLRSFYHLIDYFFNSSKDKIKILYQFPLIPFLTPFYKKDKLIILLHHVDYKTNSLKNNIGDFFGFVVLNFYPRNIKIVVVSEIWRDFLKKRGFKNITVIRNCFPNKLAKRVKEISNTNPTIKKRGFKSFYLGGASSAKGWIDCASKIRKYFPNASLWISSQYNLFLNNKEKSLLKKYRIELRILKSYSEYLDNLSQTDCCIFNSNFKEGWNRTLLEASLVCQGVIFAKEIGGMKDVIKIFPYIQPFKNISELFDHLSLISKKDNSEKLLLLEKFNEKRISFFKTNSLEDFSEKTFLNKWLNLLV